MSALALQQVPIRPVRELWSRRSGSSIVQAADGPRNIRDLTKRTSFHLKHMQIEHIFMNRIRGYALSCYIKERYFRFMSEALFHVSEVVLGRRLCVTAVVS